MDCVRKQFKMGLPRLRTCCCFFDLKTGNTILGSINAFLSFLTFVVMIAIAVSVPAQLEDEELSSEEDPQDQEAKLAEIYALTNVLVLMFLAKFLFDLLFVYGVVTERASIIKAYFIIWLVFFLLSTFTFSVNIPYYSYSTICWWIVYTGLNFYAILVCHSYYKQLTEEREDV